MEKHPEIYCPGPADSLISHGEMEIARFDEAGAILWRCAGRDVFAGAFELAASSVLAVDFNGVAHRFRYADGGDDG